jgi:hypothetical protein
MSASDAAVKAMSGAMKLQAASTLLSAVGGYFEPDQMEIDANRVALQNAQAFGVDRSGNATYGWASGTTVGEQQGQAQQGQQQFLSSNQPYQPQTNMGVQNPYTQMQPQQGQQDFIVQPKPAEGIYG